MSEDVSQVEPIGDDELRRLRELWNYLRGFDADYRVSQNVGPLLRLLARLDAAESRCAELQREVELWKRYEQEARFPC